METDKEWAKTGGRFDCEACGSAGHMTGECDQDINPVHEDKLRGIEE